MVQLSCISSGAISQLSPVAYWTPTELGGSSFIVIPLAFSYCSWGSLRQECWSGLRFPSPVDHVLSELSTMTHSSWVALYSMAHSFIELECSPPGSSVHGVFLTRILEQSAVSSSRGSSWPRDWTHVLLLLHWQEDSLPLRSPKCYGHTHKNGL